MLPEIGCKSLEYATMRLVRLMGRFAKCGRYDQLMEINEDGIITVEERPLHDEIMSELHAIVTAALELDFASGGAKNG